MSRVVRAALPRQSLELRYATLRARKPGELSAAELDELADSAWWLCQLDESLAARRRAYSAHAAAQDHRRAAWAAFHLANNLLYLGQRAVAAGWLQRAKRHVADDEECPEQGFLAILEADMAQQEGRLAEAWELAAAALGIGRRCADQELIAVATETQGRIQIDRGEVAEGTRLLDEAMTSVIAGDLGAFFTGWVYCQVVAACLAVGDLRRASEWTLAAARWCEQVPTDAPYPALCRINRAELATMRGNLQQAVREAEQAANELRGYHRPMAAVALYVLGEARRRMGDVRGAEKAFDEAHRLGWTPQPGLALLRLREGRPDAAAAALRLALDGTGKGIPRLRLLAAQVEVALAANDLPTAEAATAELEDSAQVYAGSVARALAGRARGAVLLETNDIATAVRHLRQAAHFWREAAAPYEEAQVLVLLGLAVLRAGDAEGSVRELEAARSLFVSAGAEADAHMVERLLGERAARPAGLTEREIEVLRLVAEGKSNREVAHSLSLSEHTVARHLQIIFNKLGVSSRAAATAFAVQRRLV